MGFKSAISPISSGNVSGKAAVIFSLPFMAAGLWVIHLTGFDPLNYSDQFNELSWWMIKIPKSSVPRWTLACIGLVFFLAGFAIFIKSIKEVQNSKIRKKMQKRSPHLPWKWDYDWKNGKNFSRAKTPWWNHLIGILIMAGFHAVAWTIAYQEGFKGFVLIFPIGISLFTLLIALIFYVTIKRSLAHKKVSISLENFPIRLNSNFKVHLHGINNHLIKQIQLKLSAVEESYHYKSKNSKVQCNVKWEWEDEQVDVNSSCQTIEISLPQEVKISSHLSERPATFWELQIYAKCDGPDLDKRFLLPIYE